MENNVRETRSTNERNFPSASTDNRFHRISIDNRRGNSTNFVDAVGSQGELLVTLQKPRPRNIRDANDYCDVHRTTSTAATTAPTNRHRSNNNNGDRRSESVLLSALNLNSHSNSDSTKRAKITANNTRRSASVEGDRFYNVNERSSDRWKVNDKKYGSKRATADFEKIVASSASLPTTSASVITSQPLKLSARQKTVVGKSSTATSNICSRCNKCRCVDCTTRRTLPTRWICGKSCLLSVDNVVDCMSCVCCVDACVYHATGRRRADDAASAASNDLSTLKPTSLCSSTCCLRWTILGFASAFLSPCLLCYFPLKACGKLADWAYGRRHDYGCRCTPAATSVVAVEKRSSGNDYNDGRLL